jgi:ABC-type multidrug transport system fused ATPase/permease subunit
MNSNIQNIVLKAITVIIIFFGVLFTYFVMVDDNPKEMSYEQQEQWAISEAIDSSYNETMTTAELNAFKSERTAEIVREKEEILWNDVSTIIDFTIWAIYLSIFLVIAGFIYLAVIDTKKALKILAGIGIFVVFMFIIYNVASSEVPEHLLAKETSLLAEEKMYTPENWKMASAAISATGVLIVIALLGWIGGSVMKFFR